MSEQLNEKLWNQAEKLADRPYIVVETKDLLTSGDQVYILENPEFPGLMAQGSTIEEARAELDQARIDFIYFLLVDGLEVPAPATYSVSASSAKVGELSNSTTQQQRISEDDEPQVKHLEWAFA